MPALMDFLERAGMAEFFALASLLATWIVLRRLSRIGAPGALATVLVLGMLAAVVAGSRLADGAARRELARLQSMVEGLGPTYAQELTRLGHARLPNDVAPEDPLYLELIDAQKRWLAANPTVADIYTFRRLDDGATIFLVDSETDYDHSGSFDGERESRTDPGEAYDEPDAEVEQSFAGEAQFAPEPASDRWGTWVSAYVPMRDDAGRVEAVLGIDYPAEAWVRAATAARARVLVQTGTMQLVFLAAVLWVGMARAESERRRIAAAKTQDAYERADRALRAKSDFLASMSHEIRTPMNGVIGMSELILATNPSAEHRRCAETIRGSARHLLGLINDLLDLSKAEAGRIELALESGSVGDAVEEAVVSLEGVARNKGIEIACRIPDDLPEPLLIDAMRLRQIVMNLVGNAVKFTATGRVLVRVEHLGPVPAGGSDLAAPAQEQIRIFVADTGPGIPVELRDRIFEPFTQADASIARRHGGTGLGLAICKQLVERMGGEIGVESAIGEGSRFWLVLPLARGTGKAAAAAGSHRSLAGRVALVAPQVDARSSLEGLLRSWDLAFRGCESPPDVLTILRNAAARGEPFDTVVVDDSDFDRCEEWLHALREETAIQRLPVVLLTSSGASIAARVSGLVPVAKPYRRSTLFNALAETLQPAQSGAAEALELGETAPSRPTHPISALVIDDNIVNQQVATAFLHLLGCSSHVASSGHEGLERATAAAHDVIFMDVQMPDMDGLSVSRAIRERAANGSHGRRVPIVALTAHAQGEDRDACLAAGMDDYLSKPFTLAQLHEVLKRWVPAAFEPLASDPKGEGMCRSQWEAHPVLDSEVIERFRSIGAELGSDVIGDVVTAYRSTALGAVTTIRSSLGADDADGLRCAAHGLKGGSLQIGAKRVAEIARQLEALGGAGRVADATEAVAQLESEVRAVLDELAKHGSAS